MSYDLSHIGPVELFPALWNLQKIDSAWTPGLVDFHIELPFDHALAAIEKIGGYNNFVPAKVCAALREIDALFRRKPRFIGDTQVSRLFSVAIGREGSPVIYLDFNGEGEDWEFSTRLTGKDQRYNYGGWGDSKEGIPTKENMEAVVQIFKDVGASEASVVALKENYHHGALVRAKFD